MKAIFVHDHPFYKVDGQFYSSGNLPNSVWKRYLEHFDNLTVVGRGRIDTNAEGLSLSSTDKVKFKLFYDITGGVDYLLKKKKITQHLKPLIKKADVVILRLPSFFGSCAIEVCRELNKPYVTEVVGCTWDSNWNHGSLIGKLRAPISFFKTNKQIKDATSVIYVTEQFLQKRYPSNASITSYASDVYIDDFSEEISHNHQSFLKRKKEKYRIALLANLEVKYKGFDVIFKALKLAKAKLDKPIELFLYGGGEPTYIQPLIEQYGLQTDVKIMGLLSSGSEVFQALDGLDLYVQPSLTEGLPRAVIEAMSRGCPVLASSAGGMPDLLHVDYLHKPGNHSVLAEQIVKYLPNQDALLEMSRTNFYKAKEYIAPILDERRNKFWQDVKYFFENHNKA